MKDIVTKKQHYVPKFYLKRFAGSNNFVDVLDLKKRKLIKPQPYSSVCYGEYFYALETGVPDKVSQEVERALKSVEDLVSRRLNEIIKNIHSTKGIEEDELVILASLMSLLYIRGTYMRNQIRKSMIDITKQSWAILASDEKNFTRYMNMVLEKSNMAITEEEKVDVRQTFVSQKYDVVFNNAAHLNMVNEIGHFTRLFFCKQWRIFIAGGKSKFVTSDTPVVEWFPRRKSFYGPDIFERKQYLSLTPEIFIELLHPNNPGKKVKRKMITDTEVLKHNITIARHSGQFGYSKNKEDFLDILESSRLYRLQKFNALMRK